MQPVATAIVHPCDESSLSGAVDAAKLGLIRPTLVGPKAKIQAVAEKLKLDIAGFEIVEAPTATAPRQRPWSWCATARPRRS